MGEVFLATDTRLDRKVAIKVLPGEFASDRQRLCRFEQEAKTLASLDHPNIVSIFEVGTHEGAPFLVSQFLEGRTLREELKNAGCRSAKRSITRFRSPTVSRPRTPKESFIAKLSYVSLAEQGPELVTLPESLQHRSLKLSPNDTLLAYHSKEGRLDEVYVVAFPGFTNKTVISRGGGRNPHWHPRGSELFYLTLDGRTLMSVMVNQTSTPQFGPPTKVFDLPENISSRDADFDVAADGQRFLMVQTVRQTPQREGLPTPNALLIQNWFEEFRERK